MINHVLTIVWLKFHEGPPKKGWNIALWCLSIKLIRDRSFKKQIFSILSFDHSKELFNRVILWFICTYVLSILLREFRCSFLESLRESGLSFESTLVNCDSHRVSADSLLPGIFKRSEHIYCHLSRGFSSNVETSVAIRAEVLAVCLFKQVSQLFPSNEGLCLFIYSIGPIAKNQGNSPIQFFSKSWHWRVNRR